MATIFLVRFGKVGNRKRFNENLLDVLNPASFQTRNEIRVLSTTTCISAFSSASMHTRTPGTHV